MNKCIWCGKFNQDKDIEHIIPEALGCPKDFFLDNGVVCKKCNNNLAYLDRAVIGDFKIPAFLAGVTKKKNKSPKVS
ncbi:MAG: HNH endonuclease, partial [Proteobacteria bacterium]|nr:HNH endonuclease [Pseudomonadota bacterium]